MSLSILEAAQDAADSVALVVDDVSYTFGDIAQLVGERVALGIPGVRSTMPSGREPPIAIECSPTLQTYVDILAAIEQGVPVLLLDLRWSREERDRVRGMCSAVDNSPSGGDEPVWPVAEGTRTDDRDPESCLAIVATSGSSGRAKLAVLSRRAFVAAAASSAENLGWLPNDRWMLSLPLAHIGGFSILIRCLLARKTVVWQSGSRFDGEHFIELVAQHRGTIASLVPTMLERVLECDAESRLDTLRAVLVGGARCPRHLIDKAIDRGLPVLRTYGSTETCSQVATQQFASLDGRDGCSSRGLPLLDGVEARIRSGVIEIRGNHLFSGYVGDQKRPLADWLTTSDRGHFDQSGNLVVDGRADAMISSGGELVAPREIESVISAVSGVQSVEVFGVPSDEWGETVAMAVSIDSRSNEARVLESIGQVCRQRLAPYKRPREVIVLVDSELPMTASGKVDQVGLLKLPRRAFDYPRRGPI